MIYVIWGSPNADGLTASSKNQIIAGIKKANVEVEEVNISRIHLEHCHQCGNGWGNCLTTGKCALDDDFHEVYQKMSEAEGIVFVTPVYYHDLAECFKALLDRLRRNDVCVNHFLEKKECLLVACAGGGGHGCSECLHGLEDPIRHMKMHAVDRIGLNQYSKEYILPMLPLAGEKFANFVKK